MIIEHELLKKQKRRSYYSTVEVDVYPYATELIEELDKIGIMERMKRIPQLGVVKVSKRLEKSRYDYVVLQCKGLFCLLKGTSEPSLFCINIIKITPLYNILYSSKKIYQYIWFFNKGY